MTPTLQTVYNTVFSEIASGVYLLVIVVLVFFLFHEIKEEIKYRKENKYEQSTK